MEKQINQTQSLEDDVDPSTPPVEGLKGTANVNSAPEEEEEEDPSRWQPNPVVGTSDNNDKHSTEKIAQGQRKPQEMEHGYEEEQLTPQDKDGTTMNPDLVEDPANNLVRPTTTTEIDVEELPPPLPQTQLLRATGRARRPESLPGAVQVGGTPGQVQALEEGHQQEPEVEERASSERSLSDRHLLVEATPVDGQGSSSANLNLVQADEVDPTNISNGKRSKRKHLRDLGLIALPIALVTATVIAAVILTRNNGTQQTEFQSNNPDDEGKSLSKRTLPIDEHILSLLPTGTVNDIVDDDESAQSVAYQWLLDDPSVLSYSDTRLIQRFALVVVFESLGGPNWFRNDNWKTYEDECTWYFGSAANTVSNDPGTSAITDPDKALTEALVAAVVKDDKNYACCTWDDDIPTEEYKQIVLFNNGLRGSLPDELFLLTGIEFLGLYGNSISGTLPQAVTQMSNLIGLSLTSNALTGTIPPTLPTSIRTLFLNSCRFTGSLSSTLGQLTDLEHLWVDDTPIGGTIPSELGNLGKLQVLSLFGCQLTGTLPVELSNLSSLWIGMLQGNGLSGQLPTELGLLMQSEEVPVEGLLGRMPSLYLHPIKSHFMGRLLMDGNAFTGTIPSEIASMPGLKGLSFGHNLFSGGIPTQVGLMQNLLSLTIVNTPFAQIPTEIGLMTKLTDLIMWGNQVSQIPSELFLVSSLEKIQLHHNHLHSIPTDVGLLSNAQQLLLFSNMLTGQLPSQVALMTKMEALMVHENSLSGQIPTELGVMTELSLVMIQGNRLEGTLPTEIGELTKTGFLYASRNNLNGTIPNLQRLSDMGELRFDNNELSGPIPTNLALLPSLKILALQHNALTSSIPPQLGQLSTLQRVLLQNNNLTGSLPPEMGLMSGLIVLLLSQNKLTGTIPTVLNELPSLKLLNLTSNDLTGIIDDGLCNRSYTGPAGFWGTFTGPVDSGFFFDCGEGLCGCSCDCSRA